MKTIKMINSAEIPTLLLGYTYFLNNKHNSYINIGFDSMTLDRRIILFKNNQFIDLFQADWDALMNHRGGISQFFYNNIATEIVSVGYSPVTWKLTRRKEGRVLNAVHETNKRITISVEEWQKLNSSLDFLNSVNIWAQNFQQQIRNYYSEYIRKCIKERTLHLTSDKFFMMNVYNITCNYGRLFAEIPVIASSKLTADFHQAVTIDAKE